MAESATVDLWELFQNGASDRLHFGSVSPDELKAFLGEPDSDGAGPIPFSSWIVAFTHFEFFFQGQPPGLYSLKLNPPHYAIGVGGGRPVHHWSGTVGEGDVLFKFGAIGWRDLFALPAALNALAPLSPAVRGLDDKGVELRFRHDQRELTLTYMLQAQQAEGGLFDFDYHFWALHLFDWRADAELGRTLPAGTPARAEALSEVVDALARRGGEA